VDGRIHIQQIGRPIERYLTPVAGSWKSSGLVNFTVTKLRHDISHQFATGIVYWLTRFPCIN